MNKLNNLEFKIYAPTVLKSDKDGRRIIEGYASVSDVIDRQNEVITYAALLAAEKDLLENATVFYEHKHSDLPVGKVIEAKVDKKGLKVTVELTQAKFADDLWKLIEEGILNSFSIGGEIKEAHDKRTQDGKVFRQIDKLILYEVSIVGLPANSEARFALAKTLKRTVKDLDLPCVGEHCTVNSCITKAFRRLKIRPTFDQILASKTKKLTFDQILSKDLTANKLVPKPKKEKEECPECQDIKLESEPVPKEQKKEVEKKDNEVISKPEETDGYIRIPVRTCKITATIDISVEKGITALYCGKIKKIATYIFAKAKGWTMASAQKWVKEHDSGKKKSETSKGALPFKPYTKAPIDEKWDGGAEVKAAEVKDLKEMCAWYDSANPDVKGSYKLPHHKASGKSVVWNGVKAAMGALLGARGGVDIPTADRKGVYNHLAKHYKQFDKEVPAFKNYSEEELKTLFGEEKARGEGQGQGKPRQGDGGTDTCICPKCGEEVSHTRGVPCNESKCPKCGTALVGKAKEEPWKAELATIKKALADISDRLGKLEDIMAQEKTPETEAESPAEEVPAGEEPREQKKVERKIPERKSVIVVKSPYGEESQPKEKKEEENKPNDQSWSNIVFK